MKKYGDRQSVYDGLSKMTRGGLMKDDLVLSKSGKIVSKKKSERAKENYAKYGFKKREEEKAEPKPKKKTPQEEKCCCVISCETWNPNPRIQKML